MIWDDRARRFVVEERQKHRSWGMITRALKTLGYDTTPERVRASYRRSLGAKESAYKGITPEDKKPRIAVMDIETLPMVSYTWKMYDENLGVEQVIHDSCLLSWAAKFIGTDDMWSCIMSPKEAVARDTTRVATAAWEFLHGCDIVIGHNYSQFDVKHLNTEFLKHGLEPLKYTVVDTLQVARQNFRFSSNKMAFINEQLGIRNKIDTNGFELWRECSEGDKEALYTMLQYNEGDILATEDLFYKLRPYVRNINMALYAGDNVTRCPVCGETNLSPEDYYYTPANKYVAYRCLNCGCLSRGKRSLFTADKRKSLLVNS